MSITVGQVVGRIAVGVLKCTIATAASVYINYRIKGGPPVRELYRQVKAERKMAEGANKHFNGTIVLENGQYKVV